MIMEAVFYMPPNMSYCPVMKNIKILNLNFPADHLPQSTNSLWYNLPFIMQVSKIEKKCMTTLSNSPGSGTVKWNPQSTDFSRHPSSMGNPPKASIPQPDAFVHAPEDQSFLLLPPGQLARSDPRLSPESEPELAVRLTGTARPTRLCVPLSGAQTLHPSSPKGTGSQPHCRICAPPGRGHRPVELSRAATHEDTAENSNT